MCQFVSLILQVCLQDISSMIGRHCLDGQEAHQIRSNLYLLATEFTIEKLKFENFFPKKSSRLSQELLNQK